MDFTLCSTCRSLSRSFVFVPILCLVTLSVTYAKSLPEQECQPRPTVVAVTDSHHLKPYHVQLHRCSGTCKDTTPKIAPCSPSREELVKLDVVNPATNEKTVIEVKNHTSCYCGCNLKCNTEIGEFRHQEECKCFHPNEPKIGGTKDEETDPKELDAAVLPYKIGMVIVGFIALCVLIADMIMCSRNMGVLHAVKQSSCSSRDRTDGQESYHINKESHKAPKVQVVNL